MVRLIQQLAIRRSSGCLLSTQVKGARDSPQRKWGNVLLPAMLSYRNAYGRTQEDQKMLEIDATLSAHWTYSAYLTSR